MVELRVFLLVLLAGILSVGVAFAPTVFKFGIEATLHSINALLAAILFVLVIIVATNLPGAYLSLFLWAGGARII